MKTERWLIILVLMVVLTLFSMIVCMMLDIEPSPPLVGFLTFPLFFYTTIFCLRLVIKVWTDK